MNLFISQIMPYRQNTKTLANETKLFQMKICGTAILSRLISGKNEKIALNRHFQQYITYNFITYLKTDRKI